MGNDFRQIIILNTVNKLLGNDSRSHLRIVHIRKKNFRAIHSVYHKGRNHLPDFSHKFRTAIFQRPDRQSVHNSILS